MDFEENTSNILLTKGFSEQLKPIQAGTVALVNQDIRDYFIPPRLDGNEEKAAWLSKPEIPSPEEILGTDIASDDCVELMPNQINGPWPSKDTYLKAHYELLREDAVAPLRDAVAYFRDDPQMMDSQAVSIYEKVYIIGMTYAQRGLAFRLQFSTARAGKNIVWEYSKRLISGTIVALSPADDCFQNKCAIAVIAARPLDGVKMSPAEVDIFFARAEDADFDPHQEWIMIEAKSGYYEALRHTMTALQKMDGERFPLSDHIYSLNPNIDAPEYIQENPVIDIQSAIEGSDKEGKVNVLENWPKQPTGDMDPSQWSALEQILTKRLSIVQGPPGTGKTYVSVVALRILLANMRGGDPPIVIAAQTNHALDQLLNHISCFERNYIRLGARSGDSEIKKRTLFALRQKEPMVTVHGSVLGSARKLYRGLIRSVSELLQAFNKENSDAPLSSSFFFKLGLLTQSQCDSLERGAKGWVRPQTDDNFDPIEAWLGDQVKRFEVNYAGESFGFAEDEIDLEYEQLKELEAEQGIEEDDYETLKGQFTNIGDGFQGLDISSIPEETAIDYLKVADLWRIPLKARGAVYNALRKMAKAKILADFRKLLQIYNDNCRDLQVGKWERDYLILQNAKVIGMTTTGLSKYRGLISSLNPRVILIEEAAEAIEAPISVACLNSLQHLVLVGDHQQLKGHCTVQDLEGEPFYLDTSMFERLVHNNIKYVTLRRQRRMAPEIRQLLEPIYGELQDHPSVQTRSDVPGMGKLRSFFFSHAWPESSDSLASKFNEMEAHMVVGFFVHLVLNGVLVKDITVLTFYNGQRKRLLKLMRNHPYFQGQYVKVVTVDSYQGEENEIVILSLVRSSHTKNIGFLSIENRVCVALSRARSGFYIFGNAKSLAAADALWWQVISIMGNEEAKTRRLGFYLPTTCAKHGRKTFIQDPSEWVKTNGGCEMNCGEALDCGHICALKCHSFSHDRVTCDKICGKPLLCTHNCNKPCTPDHACLCKNKCEVFVEEDSAGSGFINYQSIVQKENLSPEEESIRRYHEYANGGAERQDALLIAKAKEMSLEEASRQVQSPGESSGSLYSDVLTSKVTTSKPAKSKKSKKSQRTVPQGNLLD